MIMIMIIIITIIIVIIDDDDDNNIINNNNNNNNNNNSNNNIVAITGLCNITKRIRSKKLVKDRLFLTRKRFMHCPLGFTLVSNLLLLKFWYCS